MSAFVHWVLARRHRLIVLAMAVAPIMPIVAAALIALDTMQRGGAAGMASAAVAVGGVAVVTAFTGAGMAVLGVVGSASLVAGVGIGVLLKRSRSLGLAFQGTLLASVLIMAAITLFGPDSSALFAPLMDESARALREQGASEAQVVAFRSWDHMLLGLVGAFVFAQLALSLLLAHWWSALLSRESRFGEQFRALRLGKVLGWPATILVALALALDTPLVQNLSPLVLFGFVFQGLAVMHAWAHARQWHVGWLAPVYILLVTPFTGWIIFALSSLGLIDTWFDLRAPLRSAA